MAEAERQALLSFLKAHADEYAANNSASGSDESEPESASESESETPDSHAEIAHAETSTGEDDTGRDSNRKIELKRLRVKKNQQARRIREKQSAREQSTRAPRTKEITESLDWADELSSEKRFSCKAEVMLLAAEYSESRGATHRSFDKHPLAGAETGRGQGASACTTVSKYCCVCTSTECVFYIDARRNASEQGGWSIARFVPHSYGCSSILPPPPPIVPKRARSSCANIVTAPSTAPAAVLVAAPIATAPSPLEPPSLPPTTAPSATGSPKKRRAPSPKKYIRRSRTAYTAEQLSVLLVNARQGNNVSFRTESVDLLLGGVLYAKAPAHTIGRVIEIAEQKLRGVSKHDFGVRIFQVFLLYRAIDF